MIGGPVVWAELLNKSQPIPGRPDLFIYEGKKYRQPSYSKTTGICEVLWWVAGYLYVWVCAYVHMHSTNRRRTVRLLGYARYLWWVAGHLYVCLCACVGVCVYYCRTVRLLRHVRYLWWVADHVYVCWWVCMCVRMYVCLCVCMYITGSRRAARLLGYARSCGVLLIIYVCVCVYACMYNTSNQLTVLEPGCPMSHGTCLIM